MGRFSRWFRRGSGSAKVPGERGGRRGTVLDREATGADLAHLKEFATSRKGVEFYLEPETYASDTTMVAVAHDGEWTRRRVGSPAAARKLATGLSAPIYEAAVTGYPKRMKEWSRAHPERKLGPR